MAISDQDRRLLRLCDEVRQTSHDPNRKVGVVITDNDGKIISTGTNAPPSSLGLTVAESHEAIRVDPNWKYFVLEHAERNAMFTALTEGKSLTAATMYGTLFPCADCARAIAAFGLSRLVVFELGRDPVRDQKWLDHYRHAAQILARAGVRVETIDPQEMTPVDQ